MSGPYFLIDFENVQPKALDRLTPGSSKIKVFLGQNQNKLMLDLVKAIQPFGQDADYIQIQGSGPDAVDFHIAYYVGEIAATQPGSSFRIISKDKGFDPLIRHLTQRGIEIERLPDIPVATAPAPVAKPAKKAAATPSKVAAGKAVTTKARAKEAISILKRSTRPANLTTLRSSLMSWFGTDWGEKSVNAVLQSLVDSKIVIVTGTKVTYKLE